MLLLDEQESLPGRNSLKVLGWCDAAVSNPQINKNKSVEFNVLIQGRNIKVCKAVHVSEASAERSMWVQVS